MAVQHVVTPGDVTTARPGLGTTIWMQHSPPLVIDQDTFLLDWTGHFFSSPPQPPTLTSPPSSPPQPRRTETGRKQRKQTASSHPQKLHCAVHITTHDIANVSTAASITMSDHWSWNTFIGYRVGKLLFPFAKSHKLNVYLRPAWRWSIHCASWQSFSQRSDLGPAPPRCDHQPLRQWLGEEQRCALRSKVKNRTVNTVSRYLKGLCKTDI